MAFDATAPVVELQEVSHHYGVRPVLKNISLKVLPGQRVVIVGPNGMGKSTLLSLMAGVLYPLHGTVVLHGLGRRSSEVAEREIRRKTVFLPDQAFLPQLRTGREWLLAVGKLYEIDIDRLIDHVDRLLGLFELAKLGDSPISSYSQGQRKKLALCSAFVSETPLMLLDEPFSGGLDPAGILALKRLLQRLTEERRSTVVLSTPVPELVEELADVVIVLRDGQILAQGSVGDLKQLAGGTTTLAAALEKLVFPETLANLDRYFAGEQR